MLKIDFFVLNGYDYTGLVVAVFFCTLCVVVLAWWWVCDKVRILKRWIRKNN